METPMTRSPRVRHVLLGASLVLGPILIALHEFVQPAADWEDSASVIAAAVANPTRWQLAGLIGFAGFALLVPVAIAAADLVRGRHPALALTSTALIGVGGIMIAAVILADFTLAAATAAEASALAAWHARVEELPGAVALFPLFFAAILGFLVLAFSLWRARATARWVPVLMAASICVVFFADGDTLLGQIANVGLTVSLLAVAWTYFRAGPDQRTVMIPPARAEFAAPTS